MDALKFKKCYKYDWKIRVLAEWQTYVTLQISIWYSILEYGYV